ncbi:hypothetical protein Ancab_032939 [Ancistrocladus abbreviatus]
MSCLSTSKGSRKHKAALRLLAVSKLINQAIGDALSGLLLVEAILQHMGWSILKWNELYSDLPSRQLKVKVVDRTAVVTANAETVAVKPPGIQDAINAEIVKYHKDDVLSDHQVRKMLSVSMQKQPHKMQLII